MKQIMMHKGFYKRRLIALVACMIFLGSAQAQSGSPDSLPSQFIRYQTRAFQEKVFVHTDKSFYLAGETLWFKVYDVDAYFNRPMPASGVVYVEVLDDDHRPVFHASIPVGTAFNTETGPNSVIPPNSVTSPSAGATPSTGAGYWSIPASIISGNYILRAYTSWMKNFSPDFYFSQPLTIVNTVNASGIDLPRPKAYDIRFFPEGGHLVEGLSVMVGFKAVDQDGQSVDCTGALLDQHKDTIVRFRSARFGMGNFVFTPKKGEHYSASVTIHDSSMTRELPSIETRGYTLHLEEADKGRIRIIVHCIGGEDQQPVYLFTHTRQLFKNFRTGTLSNGQASFYIDKTTLGDGLSQITLFNSEKRPVCERLYFKKPGSTMNIGLQGLVAGYTTRQKIDLSLLATDPAGRPVTGDLSMSVFLLDSLQTLPQENILSYLLLTSDLKGKIECPSCYFETVPDSSAAASGSATSASSSASVSSLAVASSSDLDNLLLTQGWTRFNWDNLFSDRQPNLEFLPEIDGPIINGKIINKKTGLPAPSVIGYLSSPGQSFEFSTATSRPDGTIRFHAGDWIGNKELIVQTNSRTDSNYRVDIASPFSDKSVPTPLPRLSLPTTWGTLLSERSIDVQVENSYRIAERHHYLLPATDTLPFYGRPDLQYTLEDYTKFATLEEVMKEYVLDVRLRRQSGKFSYRVRNAPINLFFEEAPLLLLDGLPVSDVDRLMKIDPARIRKIDILTRKYYTGALENEGIISYRSVEGDLAGYTLDPDAVVLEYNGLQQNREFYTPIYDNKTRIESRLPDLRNQLQWSPSIHTDTMGKSSVSINTSDRPGMYAVVLQGMDGNGLLGATILTFNVSK